MEESNHPVRCQIRKNLRRLLILMMDPEMPLYDISVLAGEEFESQFLG